MMDNNRSLRMKKKNFCYVVSNCFFKEALVAHINISHRTKSLAVFARLFFKQFLFTILTAHLSPASGPNFSSPELLTLHPLAARVVHTSCTGKLSQAYYASYVDNRYKRRNCPAVQE